MGRRVLLAAVIVALVLAALWSDSRPVAAQESPTTTIVEGVKVDDPQARVDAVNAALAALAVTTALLTVAFWYHTNPRRRAKALGVEVPDRARGRRLRRRGSDTDLEPDH